MKSTAASEQKLIRGLQTGDHQAFCKVYDAYHAAIYNLCARIVGDREEAKDLTQEVFLRAFSAPPEPRAEMGVRPWLYRVATNLCLNHLRGAGGRGAGVAAGGDEIEQVVSPVDGFRQAQTVALVEETLAQLNDRYRTALVLKDLHGLPSEELAGVMETSRASADVLVHRARASFRSVFSRLAGEGAPVPGNLGLVLAPLTVPAALQFMPPLPHAPVPLSAHPAPLPHGPAPMPATPAHPFDASAGGLLGKLSAALSSKVVVTAAAASLVVGGLVAEQVVTRSGHRSPAAAAAAAVTTGDRATFSQSAARSREDEVQMRHRSADGCLAGDASCAAEHVGEHGATHEASHSTEHAGGAGTSAATSHDSTGTHDAGTGTTTHDGGSGVTSGEHDSGAGSTSASQRRRRRGPLTLGPADVPPTLGAACMESLGGGGGAAAPPPLRLMRPRPRDGCAPPHRSPRACGIAARTAPRCRRPPRRPWRREHTCRAKSARR